MARFTVWEKRVGYTFEANSKAEAVEMYLNGECWVGEVYEEGDYEVDEEDA